MKRLGLLQLPPRGSGNNLITYFLEMLSGLSKRLRILYSFPHKIGAERICTTAWHQVSGLASAGAEVTVFTGAMSRPLPTEVRVKSTLARGGLRLPYRLFGTKRTCALHDWLVARHLPRYSGQIDLVHVWPLAAKHTLKVARRFGIPSFLERPNTYTRFAFEAVRLECAKLGISMPPGYEHAFDQSIIDREDIEYASADFLLCPSDFVAKTFQDAGLPCSKLLRHQYGFDDKHFHPADRNRNAHEGLKMLYVGVCNPRKGLHYALDAWLNSDAHKTGTFSIAGSFMPGYEAVLAPKLAHPSVKLLGQRRDIPDLMRMSDVLILPSMEEGSALVTSEARGSGCVLLVSDASGAICRHEYDSLVHPAGQVAILAAHLNRITNDPLLLAKLRANSLSTINELTWSFAASRLLLAYSAGLKCRQSLSSSL